MSRLILDEELVKKLRDSFETVELCDSTGRVVGRFIPQHDMSDWEPVTPPATEEELDRRLKSNERRYTTAEVLTYLERL